MKLSLPNLISCLNLSITAHNSIFLKTINRSSRFWHLTAQFEETASDDKPEPRHFYLPQCFGMTPWPFPISIHDLSHHKSQSHDSTDQSLTLVAHMTLPGWPKYHIHTSSSPVSRQLPSQSLPNRNLERPSRQCRAMVPNRA